MSEEKDMSMDDETWETEGNHHVQQVTGFVNKLKRAIASFEVYVPRGSSSHPEGLAIRSLR